MESNHSPKNNTLQSGSTKKTFVPSEELQTKRLGSHDFFKDTRVNTCAKVKIQNGKSVAVPYHPAPPKLPSETVQKSSEIESLGQYIFFLPVSPAD